MFLERKATTSRLVLMPSRCFSVFLGGCPLAPAALCPGSRSWVWNPFGALSSAEHWCVLCQQHPLVKLLGPDGSGVVSALKFWESKRCTVPYCTGQCSRERPDQWEV